MADGLELLFKLKAQNQASPVVHAVQADVSKLKTSFGSDFNAMQGAATRALSGITQSLSGFSGQLPVVGRAVQGVSSELLSMASSSAEAGSSFAALGGPIGLAVVATLAMVGAGAALVLVTKSLAEQFFELAKGTAEWQGKLLDLSQQTGVSVETLSALDVLASQTGSSLEGMVGSLTIFQVKLDEAQDSSSKAGMKFRELGISTRNTEEAFRDALKALAAMPEGFHQTNEAAELFGRRGGKALLAILKESHGDLDGVMQRLHDLNLIVSGDSARAADEFNDQLDTVRRQLREVTAEITEQSIPAILKVLQELSRVVKENHNELKFLGEFVKGFFTPTMWGIEAVLKAVNIQLSIGRGLWERFHAAAQLASGKVPTVNPNAIPAVPVAGTSTPADFTGFEKGVAGIGEGFHGKRKGGGGGARVTKSAEERDAERQEKAELKFYEDLVERVKKTVDQLNLIDISTHKYAVEQSILNGVLSKASVEMQNMAVTEARVLDNKEKQLKLQNQLKAYFEDQAKSIKDVIEGETSHLHKGQELIELLEKQGAVLSDTTKFWIQFGDSLIDASRKASDLEDVLKPLLYTMEKLGDIDTKIDIDMSKVPLPDKDTKGGPFAAFSEELDAIGALSKNTSDIIGGTLAGAFGMLAEGVGAAVQSFILFGEVEGGFKKFAAEMISSIAATAAVQAVFQLAQGLAWLALNAFFPNPKYAEAAGIAFASAAVFGSIAGVATVAGRVLAGDSFKQGGAATGGGSGGGGGGAGGGKSDKPSTIDIGRRQGAPVPVVINLHGDLAQFDVKVADALGRSMGRNGKARHLIIDDGVYVPG